MMVKNGIKNIKMVKTIMISCNKQQKLLKMVRKSRMARITIKNGK